MLVEHSVFSCATCTQILKTIFKAMQRLVSIIMIASKTAIVAIAKEKVEQSFGPVSLRRSLQNKKGPGGPGSIYHALHSGVFILAPIATTSRKCFLYDCNESIVSIVLIELKSIISAIVAKHMLSINHFFSDRSCRGGNQL